MRLYQRLKNYGIKRALLYVVLRIFCKLKGWLYRVILSDNTPDLSNSFVLQPVQYIGKGNIKIDGATLGVWPSPGLVDRIGYIEARSSNAQVEIGNSTFINNSFVIMADKKTIRIGNRCMIGPNFFVTDSDFHGIELENRRNGNYQCKDVLIEDDVFIGDNVRILKGVRVGRGSVIGSSSLVVSDVESMCVYAGVPAKKIKNISNLSD